MFTKLKGFETIRSQFSSMRGLESPMEIPTGTLDVLSIELIESSIRSKLPKSPGSDESVLSIPTIIASAPACAATEANSVLFWGRTAIRAMASAPETKLASGLGRCSRLSIAC